MNKTQKTILFVAFVLLLIIIVLVVLLVTRPSKGNFAYDLDNVIEQVEQLDNYKESIKVKSKDKDGVEYIVEKEVIYTSLESGDFHAKEKRGITNAGRFIGTDYEFLQLDGKKYINIKTNPNPAGEAPYPLNIWIALPNTTYTDLNSKNFETLTNQLSQENISQIITDLQSYAENHSTKQSITVTLDNTFIEKIDSVFKLLANINHRNGDATATLDVDESGTLTKFIIEYSNGSIEYEIGGFDQQSITLPTNIISQ